MFQRLTRVSSFIVKDIQLKYISNTSILFSKVQKLLKNEAIRAYEVRLIYEENGKSFNQIVSKNTALDMAKKRNLDLILVNNSVNPPVCKFDVYMHAVRELQAKAAEQRKNAKMAIPKEINIGVLIMIIIIYYYFDLFYLFFHYFF